MERKKWWAGLIAVAMGFAFSVGIASAYEQGDFAEGNAGDSGKLIPYYMAGDNLATIIGVENQAGFGFTPATAAETDNTSNEASSTNNDATSGQVSIIEVRVLNAMGAVQATGQLCLKSNQFGYAVLREYMMMDDMGDMMDDMESQVVLMLGVGDEMAMVTGMTDQMTTGVSGRAGSSVNMTSEGSGIASMGYVVLHDLGTFSTAAVQEATDTNMRNDGCDSQATPTINSNSKFAAWTILQDVGEGSFFGTEIPTVTVATDENITADNADMDRVNSAATGGCGDATEACRGLVKTVASTATPSTNMVTARFDNNMENMSESMVYVWLDSSTTFTAGTGMRTPREVVAMVYCEGAAAANRVMVNLPDRINMIDGMDLGCDARGVAMITLPNSDLDAATNPHPATGAVVWSHISQMGGGFRMNFAGIEDVP